MTRVTSYIPDADVPAMTPSEAAVAAILEAAAGATDDAAAAAASAGDAADSATAADTSADAASLSATTAAGSATAAAASATVAEAAATFAVALGRYYPTVAAGVAAVAEGDLFTSDESGNLVVYRSVAGMTPYEAVATVGTPALLTMALGGTGKALVAGPGKIPYSDGDSLELLAAGAARQFLKSNGAAAPEWAWLRIGQHFPIRPTVGSYLNNGLTGTAYTATALTAGRIEWFPIHPGQDATIDEIAVVTTATGGAGSNLRIGIYADNAGQPGALLRDSGDISTNGTGVLTASIAALELQQGVLYWGCLHASATPTVRCLPLSSMLPLPTNAGTEGTPHSAYRSTQTYGALPDPAGSLSLAAAASSTVPFFRMRRAA